MRVNRTALRFDVTGLISLLLEQRQDLTPFRVTLFTRTFRFLVSCVVVI